jgi:Domain of unknown function (DUF4395)
MSVGAWMRGNLTNQGYCLSDSERRALSLGLRFSTGLCLGLVIGALALESVPMLGAVVMIGAVASFAPRHPFDYIWNHGVRHFVKGPPVPKNPPRRRDAFKVATGWLVVVSTLLLAGAATAALVLGGLLVAACATVTVTNLCLPSETFAWLERVRRRREVVGA